MAEKKTQEKDPQGRSVEPWRAFELESLPSFLRDEPLFGRFPRLVGELFRDWPGAAQPRAFVPVLDVSDDDQRYTVTVELPGTRKEDVHVDLQEGMLSIRGEKRSEREEKKEQHRYVERSYGSFCRTLRLPPDADPDHIDASFKDGVLTVTIAKSEEAKPRTIAVK